MCPSYSLELYLALAPMCPIITHISCTPSHVYSYSLELYLALAPLSTLVLP